MSPHYLVKCKTFFVRLKVMLHSSKHWWLWKNRLWCVATGMSGKQRHSKCSKWQPSARIHASNLFCHYQLHRPPPPRSAKNRPMSQQDSSATRPYRGLVLDTCALAACPRHGSTGLRPGLSAGHMSGLMNWGVSRRWSSTVSRAWCAGALSCWMTNTSPAMLRIVGSSFCISNMSR